MEEANLDPRLKGLIVVPVCQALFQELCMYSFICFSQPPFEVEAVITLIFQMGKLSLRKVNLP